MRKAVAVPYIIALILGVAVIGLVGYWFASSGGKFGSQSSRTICDNKFLQWCVSNPGGTYDTFTSSNAECAGFGSYSRCSQLLGTREGELSSAPTPAPTAASTLPPSPSTSPSPQHGCIADGQQCDIGGTDHPCCNSRLSCKVNAINQIKQCI